jgi:fructose-1,6-bisphosphatase/inositol monophosphatase family enzyme
MLAFAKSIIRDAGLISLEYFRKGVTYTTKTNIADLLTEADTAVSEFLVSAIAAKYPSHHISSEELASDINPGAEFQWVIDPIDGTRNFAMGISFWCNMLALLRNGVPVMSVVFNPIADELFTAELGQGAYLNESRLQVSDTDTVEHSLGLWCCDAHGRHVERYRGAAKRLIDTSAWLHNHGSILSGCYLAKGGADFLINNYGYSYDCLPIVLICSEAGAIVTDSFGRAWNPHGRDLVIANPRLYPVLLGFFE